MESVYKITIKKIKILILHFEPYNIIKRHENRKWENKVFLLLVSMLAVIIHCYQDDNHFNHLHYTSGSSSSSSSTLYHHHYIIIIFSTSHHHYHIHNNNNNHHHHHGHGNFQVNFTTTNISPILWCYRATKKGCTSKS